MRKTIRNIIFPAQHVSLVSPLVDFIMLGGLTLVLLPLAFLPALNGPLKHDTGLIAFYLVFVVNFPHFIHGYQLLYKDYGQKIGDPAKDAVARLRYIIAGIVSPLALIAFLVYGATRPTNDVIGFGANAMFFFVGWHYVKQGYGILMTLSAKKKVYFADFDKKLLLINAYVIWILTWIHFNKAADPTIFWGIPFKNIPVTPAQDMIVNSAIVLWTVAFAMIFIKRSDRYPSLSLNGLMAYGCALYFWVLFAYINPIFLMFVPALHSLQYLLFVWKLQFEKTRAQLGGVAQARHEANRAVLRRMVPFLIIGFGAGFVFFYVLPGYLDHSIRYDNNIFGAQLFMFCFMIFLNVHHYFIDFAIWRKDNPEMKYLFQ